MVALASGGGAHAHRAPPPAPCRAPAPRNNPRRYHDGYESDEGFVRPGAQAGGVIDNKH